MKLKNMSLEIIVIILISANCEIYINTNYRIKLNFIDSNNRYDPLTQNMLLIDTEIEAVDFEQAFSIAYNNTKDIVSYLSVILDIGFEMIHSEYLIFVRGVEKWLFTERYHTAFLDTDLEIIVKDNLNGMKSLKDKKDINEFFNGKVTFIFSKDLYNRLV